MIIPERRESFTDFMARMKGEIELASTLDEETLRIWANGIYSRKSDQTRYKAQQDPLLREGNEIYLYGNIGNWHDEVGFENVVYALDQIPPGETPVIRINSRGGLVDEGFVIANYLKRSYPEVTTVVDGMGLSIASYIFTMGDERLMADNAKLMIHQPHTIGIGTSDDFRREADILDKLSTDIAQGYIDVTGWGMERTQRLMSDTTWFNADESLDEGLATDITDGGIKAAASWTDEQFSRIKRAGFNPSRDRKVPGTTEEQLIKMFNFLADRCE